MASILLFLVERPAKSLGLSSLIGIYGLWVVSNRFQFESREFLGNFFSRPFWKYCKSATKIPKQCVKCRAGQTNQQCFLCFTFRYLCPSLGRMVEFWSWKDIFFEKPLNTFLSKHFPIEFPMITPFATEKLNWWACRRNSIASDFKCVGERMISHIPNSPFDKSMYLRINVVKGQSWMNRVFGYRNGLMIHFLKFGKF